MAGEDVNDNIPNDFVRNFVEEAYEEFLDACVEAGYVIAQGIDSWVLQQRIQNNNALGQTRLVEITPDREAEEERIILNGREQLMRSQIPIVLANHQMVENRDIGQIVGESIYEAVQASPSELSIRLMLCSVQFPPFGQPEQRVTIKLADIKRSKLDWATIKQACGGSNGYMYGRYRATARLSNNRQAAIYGNSAEEAQDRLEALLLLTDTEVRSMSVTEEIKKGAKANGKPLEKQPIRVYPTYLYLENKQKILNESTDTRGFRTLEGTYNRKRNRIPLWTEEKPEDFDEIITDLLRIPGIN